LLNPRSNKSRTASAIGMKRLSANLSMRVANSGRTRAPSLTPTPVRGRPRGRFFGFVMFYSCPQKRFGSSCGIRVLIVIFQRDRDHREFMRPRYASDAQPPFQIANGAAVGIWLRALTFKLAPHSSKRAG
jgi:hypothetical protein